MCFLPCFAPPCLRLPLATPAAAVLLPALAFVLTRRRVELRLSLG